MIRRTRAMELLVKSLDDLLSRMKEHQRQYEIEIAFLQKNDYRVIQLYPDKENENGSGHYQI